MWSEETNIIIPFQGWRRGQAGGGGTLAEHLHIVKKRFLSLNMYLSNLFHLFL